MSPLLTATINYLNTTPWCILFTFRLSFWYTLMSCDIFSIFLSNVYLDVAFARLSFKGFFLFRIFISSLCAGWVTILSNRVVASISHAVYRRASVVIIVLSFAHQHTPLQLVIHTLVDICALTNEKSVSSIARRTLFIHHANVLRTRFLFFFFYFSFIYSNK